MAADPHHIDPTEYLEELLTQASPDLMRQMLGDFINQILSAQADSICGAGYATVSDTRTNSRNVGLPANRGQVVELPSG